MANEYLKTAKDIKEKGCITEEQFKSYLNCISQPEYLGECNEY